MSNAQVILPPESLMSDPPASLTERGLEMLQEVWEALGRPAKPEDGQRIPFVEIAELKSHRGSDAKLRETAQVRRHLAEGGYLWLGVDETPPEEGTSDFAVSQIHDIALSAKAYDALAEAGIIRA